MGAFYVKIMHFAGFLRSKNGCGHRENSRTHNLYILYK